MIEVGSVVVLADGSPGRVVEIFGADANVLRPMDGQNYKVKVCSLTGHILNVGDRVQAQIPPWMVEEGFNPVPNTDDQFGTVIRADDRERITVQTKTRVVTLHSIYLRKI
jgi:hypothetical protein